MAGLKDLGKGIAGLGQGIAGSVGAFGSAPGINAAPFQGIRTQSVNLSPQGVLSRRSGAGQLVPKTEAGLISELQSSRVGLGGLRSQISGLRAGLEPIKQRTEGLFGQTAALKEDLLGQLPQLIPAFGRISEARTTAIRSAASKASGNLRANFGKRDIGGASFANDQIASIQKDFATEESRVKGEAILQEIDARNQIIAQVGNLLQLDQATLNQQAAQTGLALGLTQADAQLFAQNVQNIQVANAVLSQRTQREMNELNIAGNIITRVQAIQSQVAIEEAKLEAKNAEAAGKGIASAFTGFGDVANAAVGFFGGPAGAAASGGIQGGAGAGGFA